MYKEQAPPPKLGGLVRCLWTSRAGASLIVPDGCLDLIVAGERVFVAGPDTRPWHSSVKADTLTTGIRFEPGAAPQVLGVAADELRDQRPSLEALWGKRGRTTAERLLHGSLTLSQVVADNRDGDTDPAVRRLLTRLDAGVPRVSDALRDLPVGQRQLRRRFTAAVGYGPATYLRVARLRRAIALAESRPGLARLAYASGYADQAHLSRECLALTGVSPSRYFARHDRSVQASAVTAD